VLAPHREAVLEVDEHEPVAIASRDDGSRLRERREEVGVRVAVVVLADPDEGEAGAEPQIQLARLIAAAVVRDLHDVERARNATRRRQQLLRILRQVAEEQRARHPRSRDLEHEARVVAGPERARVARGPEHPPRRLAERAVRARERLAHLARDGAGGFEVAARLGGAVEDRRAPARERRHARDVVGVEVREEGEVDATDPQPGETSGEGLLVGASVDDRDAARRAQHNGVSLADVAQRDRPVARCREGSRDAPERDRSRAGAERDGEDPRARAAQDPRRAARRQARDHHDGARAEDRERNEASDALLPREARGRQGREDLGRARDPRRREPGERGSAEREGREGMREARHEPQHGRGGGRGARDHVRHDPVERDLRGEEHDDGAADDLRRERHRDAERQRPRHPPVEPAREGLRQQQERARRAGGKHEAVRRGEPRVGGHEHGDREREHGRPRAPAAEEECEHRDRRHRGRADHARLGGDEHDEAREHRERDDDPRAAAQPARRADRERDAHDERAVAAGDGREVAQRRRLHGLIEFVRHAARLADREPRQQPGAGLGQPRDGVLDETAPQRARGGVDVRRGSDDLELLGEHERGRRVARLGRR